MLEWICQKCGRAVDPAFTSCPFCDGETAKAPASPVRVLRPASRRRLPQPFNWTDVERGFRFGLGFVAALACAYFVLFLIAYALQHETWLDRLARWLHL